MKQNTKRKLGLAGLLLTGAMSFLTPKLSAQPENVDSLPKTIATFEYQSNRPEPEYSGKTFTYNFNVMSDGTFYITQEDPKVEQKPRFAQRWFWDVDGDGKFGDAEINAMKSGKLVYMHPEFNKIANSQTKKIFETLIAEKEESDKTINELEERLKYTHKTEDVSVQYEAPAQIIKEKETPKTTIKTPKKDLIKPSLEKPALPEPILPEEYTKEEYTKMPEECVEPKEITEPVKPIKPAKEKIKESHPVSFIIGGRFGPESLYGFETGLKYNRLALVADVNKRADKNILNVNEELINDVYFKGREDIKDFLSIGASLEYHQPITKWLSGVIGAGANKETYTRVGEATLVKRNNGEESIINSNTQSFSESELSGKVYGGPSFKLTEGLRLNVNLGYEFGFKEKGLEGRGAYFNLRAIISGNNKNKNKSK